MQAMFFTKTKTLDVQSITKTKLIISVYMIKGVMSIEINNEIGRTQRSTGILF